MKSVSVVVPTHRRPHTLRQTLQALLAVEYPPAGFEVIVVDDAGEGEAEQVVAELGVEERVVVLSQHRLGAATARNAGARLAEGDVLLFCDDDFIVEPSHLRAHTSVHASHRRAVVGSNWWYSPTSLAAFQATSFGRYRVKLEQGFQAERARAERQLRGRLYETPTLGAADLSIRREGFWELGGFDERFPYAGAEDQDLCIRAKRAGFQLIRNYELTPQHNDPTVTLEQFGLREERGAETVVVFQRKYPEAGSDFGLNAPLSRRDDPRLIMRKLVKSALSYGPVLTSLHHLANGLERAGASDRILHRVFRTIVGLHLFRGYRAALEKAKSAE